MAIRTIKEPISKEKLKEIAKEEFGNVVKAVVDVEQEIMAIGGELHADEEVLLMETENSKRKNMRNFLHKELASGGWSKFSLAEQFGNISSEVSRAIRWRGKDKKLYEGAIERALELFDLTLEDNRWRGRLREIARVREVFCDAVSGGQEYKSSLEDLELYFFQFAVAARMKI
ncbi:MAG: hypothetical protein UW81_C0026G0009 [Candidatus Giovannonibacteria bacterium GW2011_GWC2_44_9]|uniref:Uncharacterized protein n=2 Tax=Candidatus Giovannoniibacteriota TaxID=1752738 RepID=A0A0G1IU80_9BACT|nr:MAG: hypothetical protein UW57_C0012G0023 [Candidatus Giovannonibacteria bacterium GW2011_GWA1_44_29]KKT83101.1 MAG: hypothetical protein UW81_C0026G0009 [Candidatus Giovannonibacteria bacterium GW2011_GWC2_44_9]KKT90991.1 MAG: hypothetical protein UW93_C0015G0003 [Parcubacteria group bacterium GW2011_GWC1_45_13]KKU29467.1 MAG: hypothetical protein UX43_C0012G0009 [Candidatus Giovannonibacteria bacterium GW2011_GWB1_46_20]